MSLVGEMHSSFPLLGIAAGKVSNVFLINDVLFHPPDTHPSEFIFMTQPTMHTVTKNVKNDMYMNILVLP